MSALIDKTVGSVAGDILHLIAVYDLGGGARGIRRVTPATLLDAITPAYKANIGNGVDTTITVTHSLNTRDVEVVLFDNTTYETVVPVSIRRATVNTLTINFGETAPSSNAYRCLVKAL